MQQLVCYWSLKNIFYNDSRYYVYMFKNSQEALLIEKYNLN